MKARTTSGISRCSPAARLPHQDYARAAGCVAGFNELYAGGLERLSKHDQRGVLWFGFATLEIADGGISDARGIGQVLLGPIEERACGSALCSCDHFLTLQARHEKRYPWRISLA